MTFTVMVILPEVGGGSTPLYRLYRCVRQQGVWFLKQFRLKLGMLMVNLFIHSKSFSKYYKEIKDKISLNLSLTKLT